MRYNPRARLDSGQVSRRGGGGGSMGGFPMGGGGGMRVGDLVRVRVTEADGVDLGGELVDVVDPAAVRAAAS